MTEFSTNLKVALTGLQITIISAFLSSYGGSQLALPSFGLAAIGTLIFGYGLMSGEN